MNSVLLYQKVLFWVRKNERHLSSGALLFGFILDNLTLRRVDLWVENIVLLTYITIAFVSILVMNLYDGERFRKDRFPQIRAFAPITLQFAFGALFSGFFVFYSRSASVISSWPFLLFLFALLIGNEFFRSRYERLNFHVGVLFIVLFSYAIFAVPILLRRVGDGVFLLSGLASIVLIAGIMLLLYSLIPKRIAPNKFSLIKTVGGIYITMHLLYFLNLIPPIPLALKDIGVYHSLVRVAGNYIAEYERQPWYTYALPETLHVREGGALYVFSSVFAPTKIQTDIVHKWEHYDEKARQWKTESKLQFAISGGRDGGYRGYTWKRNITEGRWRVSVETPSGQLLGRKRFNVEMVETGSFTEKIQK